MIIKNFKYALNIFFFFVELIAWSFFILFSVGVFIYHYSYTIYMGWYIFVINIYLLLIVIIKIINYINNNKFNMYILHIERCCLFISIILFIMPLNCIILIFKINIQWMSKYLLFLFSIINLLIIIFSFTYKIAFLLFLSLILFCILLFIFFIIYFDNNKIYYFLKKYHVIISLIISSILYYVNNNVFN
jgi:hypothetical protein